MRRHARELVLPLQKELFGAADAISRAFARKKILFVCGNGGSASQALHCAGEFVGRLRKERERDGLPAMALGANPAAVTAIANDYGYEEVFARELDALGKKGDVLLALSTSGNSKNILRAIAAAKKKGIATIGLFGAGGKAESRVDIALSVPSRDTQEIQEAHLAIIHLLAALAEEPLIHA